MPRILSVSSSRSDVGILMPVWRALVRTPGVELHVLLTGMHAAAGAAFAVEPPAGAVLHRGGADLGGRGGAEAANAMASILAVAGEILAEVAPDALFAVSDRLDMLPAAMASLPFNTPLVHLHGGEITEGAVDDRIRHAVSKLAHFHCVASDDARLRLLAMGEEDWRIRVTGAPGLDTLLAAPELGLAELASCVGLAEVEPFRLVTVHPETNSDRPLAALEAVLEALAARPANTLATAPNSDPGGAEARGRVEEFCAAHPWARFVDTLGPALYPAALRHATLMLGNSSSGLVEAGLFGLPVVNVGDRQAGRLRGGNVIDVPNAAAAIVAALDRLGPHSPRRAAHSPYGDGASGPRIAGVLSALPERARLLRKRAPVAVPAR